MGIFMIYTAGCLSLTLLISSDGITAAFAAETHVFMAHPYKYVRADLQEFAGEGLRTLALAYKDLDEEYFNQWRQRHHEASTSLEDKDSKLDELYEEIEKDLLVGR